MKNIDKIQKMDSTDWLIQAVNDEHLIPSLCFMCIGNNRKCDDNCSQGIYEWLESEATE